MLGEHTFGVGYNAVKATDEILTLDDNSLCCPTCGQDVEDGGLCDACYQEAFAEGLVTCAECSEFVTSCDCKDCDAKRPADDDPYQRAVDNEITG